MPAGVVVVKRARRRSFALLWAAVAWAASVASSLRGRASGGVGEGLSEPAGAIGVASFPALRQEPVGSTRCTACGECVEVCPADCLAVAGAEERPLRFTFDPGACIGCGRCIERCPEAALVPAPVPPFLPVAATRLSPMDLLAGVERADGSEAPSTP